MTLVCSLHADTGGVDLYHCSIKISMRLQHSNIILSHCATEFFCDVNGSSRARPSHGRTGCNIRSLNESATARRGRYVRELRDKTVVTSVVRWSVGQQTGGGVYVADLERRRVARATIPNATARRPPTTGDLNCQLIADEFLR